jgi:hypothetical protein
MKKFLLTTTMVLSAFLFTSGTKAQVRFGLSVNIGNTPSWGLQGNYAGDYYYMPEIDTYYDIPHRQFIYNQGNDWVSASQLPMQYRNYDLNRGYKVAVNGYKPYLQNNVYRQKYSSYYNNYQRDHGFGQRQGGFNNNHFDNNRGRDDRFDNRRDDRNDRGRGNGWNDRNDKGRGNDRNDHGRDSRGRG